MTPVRCCMAGCRSLGEFFEPDGGFWFCDPCYDIHLALRREDYSRTRTPQKITDGRRSRKPCGSHAVFVRHKAKGEQPCDPCRDAERIYQRERWARRAAS